MATDNKDFKVKHGLLVTDGGSFGGPVTVASPTSQFHAATKEYVDTKAGAPAVPAQPLPPENPVDGQMYFDTDNYHLVIYSAILNEWVMLANYTDTADLKQHIHDTAIDGTGLIVSVFQDAGFYNQVYSSEIDATYYNTGTFAMSWDGGIAIDNFN